MHLEHPVLVPVCVLAFSLWCAVIVGLFHYHNCPDERDATFGVGVWVFILALMFSGVSITAAAGIYITVRTFSLTPHSATDNAAADPTWDIAIEGTRPIKGGALVADIAVTAKDAEESFSLDTATASPILLRPEIHLNTTGDFPTRVLFGVDSQSKTDPQGTCGVQIPSGNTDPRWCEWKERSHLSNQDLTAIKVIRIWSEPSDTATSEDDPRHPFAITGTLTVHHENLPPNSTLEAKMAWSTSGDRTNISNPSNLKPPTSEIHINEA